MRHKEKILSAALTAVLRDINRGVVIGVENETYLFFVDGDTLHMRAADRNDPAFADTLEEGMIDIVDDDDEPQPRREGQLLH
jgi:hypothetical protein